MMRFATSRTLSALLMSLAVGGASLGCDGPEPEYPSTPVARPFKKSRRQPKMPETASETEKPEGIAADEVPGEFLPKAVFPTCTMAANAPLQEFWLALQFEGKDTVEGVARGLAPVGCLLAPTLSELRTREPELARLEESLASYAASLGVRGERASLQNVLAWRLAAVVRDGAPRRWISQKQALAIVAWATNPELVYASAFALMAGDALLLPAIAEASEASGGPLVGATVLEGSYQRQEPASANASGKAPRRALPPLANRAGFAGVASNPFGIGAGVEGFTNATLDRGELATLELAAQPTTPGTWLASVSALTTTIPWCVVAPWAPEAVATESDEELYVRLPNTLVSARCGQREELKLTLVSSSTSTEQSLTLALSPSPGPEVTTAPALLDLDVPGSSEPGADVLVPGLAAEITPRLRVQGLDGLKVEGAGALAGDADAYERFVAPSSPRLVGSGDGNWKLADDFDVKLKSSRTVGALRTENCSRKSPLTCDRQRLWFWLDLSAERPDRYRLRRYFSVPLKL